METSWINVAEAFVNNNTNIWLITTIFLIAYIGVSKKCGTFCDSESKKECESKKKKNICSKLIQRDYTYLIVIMLIVSTFLISLSLYTNENAIGLFSFASTIASIILSVIAIILTITSETKNASTKEKLEKSVEQIEEKTEILEKVSKEINSDLLQEFGQKISQLDASMQIAIKKIEEAVKNSAEAKEAVKKTRPEGNLEMKDENIEIKTINEYIDRYRMRGDKDA